MDVQLKANSCMQVLSEVTGSADVCDAWQTYQCCLKDALSPCGSVTQKQFSTMMDATQTQLHEALPGLSDCVAVTCSLKASASPGEVETTLMAFVLMDNPLAFNLTEYTTAVKMATGASQDPIAVLHAFDIAVSYVVADGTELEALKAAVAKANSVTESQVTVATGVATALDTNVDVTISVPNATKAVDVMLSSVLAELLQSQLGGTVHVPHAAKATAKVETKVRSVPSVASQLATKFQSAGADIGANITAEMQTEAPAPTEAPLNSASSNFDILLAVMAVLVPVAM